MVLTTAADEAESAMMLTVLHEAGIEAQPEGALTSALRAEVPGGVNILIHARDYDMAYQALTRHNFLVPRQRGLTSLPLLWQIVIWGLLLSGWVLWLIDYLAS